MSYAERALAKLTHREKQLRDAREAEGQARTLNRAMHVVYGCESLEDGITNALRLCQETTHADLWMLLRRIDGCVIMLASGPKVLCRFDWADEEDFLSRARRVTQLPETRWFDGLPEELRAFRSMVSAPLDLAGEPPMAMLLFSRQNAAFSRSDHELLLGTSYLVKQAARNRYLEDQNSVLAKVLNNDLSGKFENEAFLETSFQALSRVYARLAEWQAKIVEITNELLSAPVEDSKAAINRALARTGALAASDRSYVFCVRDPDRIDNTHEWTASGIEPMIAHLQDMPVSLMDEWHPDMAAGRAVHIPDVATLPEASPLRKVLMPQAIRSMLAVPMLRDGRIVGFVGFDAVRAYRKYLPLEIQLLQAVANAINIVLDRRAAETAAESARANLEAERNRLNLTLAAMPDLMLELDHDGRFIAHVSGAAGPQIAVPPSEFLGRMPEDVLPPDLAALARRVIAMIDRDGTVTDLEYELTKDGVSRWYSLSAAAKSDQGHPCGYLFVIRDITEKLVQRRRLLRLSKVAELTSNLVIMTDADQRIEWVNPAFEHRTGWHLGEILGKRPDSLLASDKTDRAEMQRIGTALRKGEPVRAELLNQTRDGEEYWISKDIQPLLEPDGKVAGFVAVQTDITNMKLTHQQALEDRATALDASGDGIAITDASGDYVYMNAAHRSMFGITDDEDIRRLNWRDLLPADTVATFMSEHWDSFAAVGTWRGELDGLHRDGSAVPHEVSLTLRENGILCIARDISERRQMERALHNLAAALEASDDGIAITDASGHYIYMNSAHRHMFGISDGEDIRALHWQDIYPKKAVQQFMAREWAILQATGRWRGELHGVHRDGSPVPQEVSLTLHDDGILCLTHDISTELQQAAERTNLREELQLAQRRETMAHLASGVAHDLNNLIAVTAGSVSLLEQKITGDSDAIASLSRIKRATQTARELVDGMGQLARPQGQRTICDLRNLIVKGVDLLSTKRSQDQALSICLPETPCLVWANETELLQVIVNLALNACEANTELPKRVTLAISRDVTLPDHAPDAGMLGNDIEYSMFTISDSGMGIDDEVRSRLFRRYFTTKGEHGTGLGLPIVAGILRDNLAALWIDSAPGLGTSVKVAWPTSRSGSRAPQLNNSVGSTNHIDLSGHNILVVDDLPDVADVLSEFLEASGANVVAIADPAEAAKLLRDNPGTWAALVTDLDMPKVNGTALARIAAGFEPAVPVVLVTALPETINSEDTLFSAVLPKPVTAEQIVDKVGLVIHQAKATTMQQPIVD